MAGEKEKFVIDTSAFLTDGIRRDGEKAEDAISELLDLIERARDSGMEVYMPPSTEEELLEILEDRELSDEDLSRLEAYITRKSPSRYEVKIPGEMLYRFVEEMRERVNKGLRISEKAVRRELEEIDEPSHEHRDREDVVVSDLRDDYKEALRKGIVDSKEDLDLLLLARELECGVVTEDQGIISWAEDLGLSYIRGRDFPDFLKERIEK